MEVIKEFDNTLLKRKEITAQQVYSQNPGFEQATKDLAAQFKAEENTVVVKTVSSSFGSQEFIIEAFMYDSAEQKDKIEPKKKEKKK